MSVQESGWVLSEVRSQLVHLFWCVAKRLRVSRRVGGVTRQAAPHTRARVRGCRHTFWVDFVAVAGGGVAIMPTGNFVDAEKLPKGEKPRTLCVHSSWKVRFQLVVEQQCLWNVV